jgi:CubicO group peptidase (beta-lactamase class C family)
MLLTHTSSISDLNNNLAFFQLQGSVDYPQKLDSFLEDFLTPGGQYYSEDTFLNTEPGGYFKYSNIGVALLGLIVENVSGSDFNQYCKDNIFSPLGMEKSSFSFEDTPIEEIAIPYYDANNAKPDNPFFSYPDFPAGHLITTALDMSNFLRAYIMDGTFNEFQLLHEETINLMLQNHFLDGPREQGFVWRTGFVGDTKVWRHGGADTGVTSNMVFDPLTKTGFIVLMNRHSFYPEALYVSLLKYSQNNY